VAAGQERDEGLIDDLALAEDDPADAVAYRGEAVTERVDVGGEVAAAGAETNGRKKAFGIAQERFSLRGSNGRRVVNETSADDRDDLARIEAAAAAPRGPSEKNRAPPRDCGHFDIRINRDGSWFYRGTPINRAALVRLFGTVLERDAAGVYWLATPAERGRITVEDAPFLAVEVDRRGAGDDQALIFRTNLGDFVTADAAHRLRVETDSATQTPRPYILVRNRLEARLARPVFYALVEWGVEERVGDTTRFGVWSKRMFFPLDPPAVGA
jgi:uncharacterized protein